MAAIATLGSIGDLPWDETQAHRLRGRASLAVGRHLEALEALRNARRARLGSEAVLVDLEEIDALFGLRRYADALAVATRALRRPRLDADADARLRITRGQALWGLGRVAAAARQVEVAMARAGAELTRARAHEALAVIAWKEQRLEAAAEQLERAAQLYLRGGSRDGLVRTLEKQGAVLRDAAALDEALRVQTLRLEMASATTRLDAIACARSDRGSLYVLMGRWREAREDLAYAADLFRRVSDPREFTLAGVQGTALALAEGDLAGARAALTRAREAAPAERADPRTLAETLLCVSDLELADGAAPAAADALAQALGLFALLRDRVGECRARYRRSHVLLALGRQQEAVREARQALRVARWPARSDLRAWSELALGRALLSARLPEAAAAFERALGFAHARPVVAHMARFGRALAQGAGAGALEVRDALSAVEAWGERRLLAYCFADLRGLTGEGRPTVPCLEARPTPASTLCATARAVAEAAVALAGTEGFAARWAEAMRALRPLLSWQRAALVSPSGLELRAGEKQVARLAGDDLARCVAARASEPEVVDLAADPELASHPMRLLRGLRWAVVAPLGDGSALYLELAEVEPEPAARQLEALRHVARLVGGCPGEPADDEPPPQFPEIVGRCPAMQELFRQMQRLAGSEVAIHLFGETGTGKERAARALHRMSPRGARAFVALNASALSDELFEAELFGHVRGAFSGAVADRNGLLAEAEGGTLFLDEVGDLSGRAQAKLLRLLQEREYRRVGESRTRRADVRVLTAANVQLEQRVAAGSFRADLMYRLNGVVLTLPPLRERGDDDLLRLARHFLRGAAERAGRRVPALSRELVAALRRYAWPGNVRELENEMTRLVALAGDGPLRHEHLSPRIAEARRAPLAPLRDAVIGFEREHVGRMLALHAGNRSRAACALGLTRQGLLAKLRRLGIS